MYLSYAFFFSGAILAVLLVAKRIEERKKTRVFLLRLISRGEEHARKLQREAVRRYSLSKEEMHFFMAKQLPRYSKSSLNKALARFEESMQKYLERLRDSRLLKKDEGISEFFKSMAEGQKGQENTRARIILSRLPDSDRGPSLYKSVALPTELRRLALDFNTLSRGCCSRSLELLHCRDVLLKLFDSLEAVIGNPVDDKSREPVFHFTASRL